MARPKRVYPSKLSEYNLLHSTKQKMFSGVEITALHIVKETEKFYISLDSWSSFCGNFKKKKPFDLSINLPIISDDDALSILKDKSWDNYVEEEKESDSDIKEAVEFLDRIFPDKKKVYSNDLYSLIGKYSHGYFGKRSDDGQIIEGSKRDINRFKSFNGKINEDAELPEHITYILKKAHSEKDDTRKSEYYKDYFNKRDEYHYNFNNKIEPLHKIGEKTIVIPYAFTKPTVKGFEYEHAGDIYLVVTEDTVYFEQERHF